MFMISASSSTDLSVQRLRTRLRQLIFGIWVNLDSSVMGKFHHYYTSFYIAPAHWRTPTFSPGHVLTSHASPATLTTRSRTFEVWVSSMTSMACLHALPYF